jgi:phosphohistidine swiveling domain-containing protein
LKSAAPPLIKTVAGRFFLRFGAVRPLLNPYAGASTGGAFALTAWLIRTLLDARRFRRRPPPSPAATPADNPDALCAALQQTVHGRLRPLIRRQTNWTFAAHLLRSWGTELAVGASRAAPGSSAASASDHAAAPLFPLMEAELMLAADEPPASTPTLPAAADRWAFPEDADHNVPARRQLTAWLNAAGGSLEAARDRAKLDILRLNHALHDLANRLGEALKLPPNAAYFHTMAELSALAAGRGGPTADELERRQAEYEANRRSAPGAILLVDEDGAVHAPETPTDGGARRGVAIVSGQASGEAMTLDAASPPPLEAVDAGKILVIPDGRAFWIPYLARAGGAVLAGGSILSHLAVAGRELGVPLVLFPSGFAAADGRRVEIAGGEARADEHG